LHTARRPIKLTPPHPAGGQTRSTLSGVFDMQRRDFLKASTITLATTLAARGLTQSPQRSGTQHTFKLKYAPHFGMFEAAAGAELVDQLKFAADQGFTAWEDNGMKGRPVADQQRVADAMQKLGITMGVFVATGDLGKITFTVRDNNVWDGILKECRDSVEVAKRLNAKWMTVVLGKYSEGLEWDYQTANCVELLKRCCEIFEPNGLVMVLEALNWYRDHPGVFLHKIPQAFQICRAVGSPSCKILFDIYHQQISEGNLIPNMDMAWDEIGYFQIGDNPGRNEPGTGEINYHNIFRHLHEKGYTGVLGMEHGNSQPGNQGVQAVIDAYVAADSF
jgi:hydroxypyruvate isomerase